MAGISSEQTGEGCRLRVAGEANIAQASGFRTELVKAFESGQALSLDLSAVSGIDLAFAQLILAAQVSAAARGLTFAILPGVAPAFTQFIRTAALETYPWPIKPADTKV